MATERPGGSVMKVEGLDRGEEVRELTDGSEAIARGALDGGCRFFAGYPITPASPILGRMLAELPKIDGIGIQAEDEISAIGMCIGAAMTGRRAMTATSGPGMSLYSENLGLAIMGEVPLVVVDVQRLGPATGGATTTAQGDVQLARWGTSGGYPIIALAPSSVVECYRLTRRAFDLAARFRCPVLLLIDKELALTLNTVPLAARREEACAREPAPGDAAPETVYRFEPAGETWPLHRFGGAAATRFTGSTHDEKALLTRDPATVERLNRHLAAKLDEHAAELELVAADLDDEAEVLLVSYGSTAGAQREAVRALRRAGRPVSALTVLGLWPVPRRALRRAASGVRRVVVAELNLGQYRREVERVLPGFAVEGLQRVDGRLLSPRDFLEAVG